MATNQYLDYTGLQRLVENIDKKYAPIAALIFKGSVDNIAALPTLNNNTVKVGWVYDVKVGGGTTTDFIEGAGHILGDGENVACVELITGYTAVDSAEVTPDKDPKKLGWYESDGQAEPTYTLSNDRIADSTKTYYTADTVQKWDILGGVFDLEGRYLEFGNNFPQGPASRMVEDRTFLYMGTDKKVYTAVAAPSGRPSENGYFEGTFTAVADTSTIVNPKQVPLYEIVADAEQYFEVTPEGTENPEALGWYVSDGATPPTYTKTTDTTVQSGTTYFKRVDTFVRTTDATVDNTKTYFEGAFVASLDTTVDPEKVYYTEDALYTKAVIYRYDATNKEWIAQSSGGSGDMVPITNPEIDELFI